VGDFVSQIFSDAIAPVGVDGEANVGLDEDGPPLREVGVSVRDIVAVRRLFGEEEDVNWLFAGGHAEPIADELPFAGELGDHAMAGGQ
jgi:hypothetical protein